LINITKVQIHVYRPKTKSNVKAFADIIMDDAFIVRGLVVVTDANGTHYVNMPNRLKKNGDRRDIAHPITEKCRQLVEKTVLDEYEKVLNGMEKSDGTEGQSEV